MRYLLDTSTCIELLRSGRGQTIRSRIEALQDADIVLCSVVRYELIYGALRSERRDHNLGRVREFLDQFSSLGFDDAAAEHAAEIRRALEGAGTPIGPADLLIAAIARSAGAVMVTCNAAEFARVSGLAVEDWRGRP